MRVNFNFATRFLSSSRSIERAKFAEILFRKLFFKEREREEEREEERKRERKRERIRERKRG